MKGFSLNIVIKLKMNTHTYIHSYIHTHMHNGLLYPPRNIWNIGFKQTYIIKNNWHRIVISFIITCERIFFPSKIADNFFLDFSIRWAIWSLIHVINLYQTLGIIFSNVYTRNYLYCHCHNKIPAHPWPNCISVFHRKGLP